VDGRGIAPHWRFTDLAHGTHPPTRDYEKWSGELFVYTPRRLSRKKQNPVRPCRTPQYRPAVHRSTPRQRCPMYGHAGHSSGSEVYGHAGHI
jgi:hypothetical protein